MDLTVQGILKTELLEEAKVIAGNSGTENIITGITIMEAPDIADWIKGGELILTSLYTLNTFDIESLENIIKSLNRKNISAIAFKKRKSDEVVPNILLELGNKYNIPIILLPTKIAFLDIMNPLMATIFNKQMIILKHYKEVHNKFTSLVLENKELDTIVDTLSELLKNPVSVYDRKHKLIYSNDKRLDNYEVLENISHDEIDNTKEHKYPKQKVKLENVEDIEVNQIIVPVTTINNLKIYLKIYELYRELKELDYITIEHAVTVISFDLVKQFSISQVEKRFESDLIDDLINDKVRNDEELYQKANYIGLNTNNKHVIVSLEVNSSDDEIYLNDNSIQLKIQNLLYDTINDCLPKCFIRIRSSKITILCDVESWLNDNISPITNIKKILRQIQNIMSSKVDNIVITAGISNILCSIFNIVEHYKESLEALELGELIYNKGSITSFDELGILRLLCKLEKDTNLENYIPNELMALKSYDDENNSNLLNTLENFINYGCNASKAAKSMYIHYKTIMYRLDKIKNIADIDTSDTEKMLEIQVGLKILKIINKK